MSVSTNFLRDNFTDNIVAPAWSASNVGGSATFDETGGQAVLTLPSSVAGSHIAYYRSAASYDLTGDDFVWNIGQMVATGVAATATFDLFLDTSNVVRWQQLSNAITARKIVAGVDTQLFTATWSATTYKYLRISESGGTITFWSSTNGTSWTSRATLANPFAVTSLFVQFTAACGNVASPGALKLDDVNLILPTLSTNWHWTQVEWPLLYRFRSVTLAAVVSSGQGYIATSNDGTTWAYYSGPMGSASGGFNQLTLQTSQAAAQAMAVNLPANNRWDLPEIVECRFIRLYHRSITGSSYTVREYYPRRLVQSDDVEAESINAINIAAHSITADKIAAHTITAAEIGTVNLDATARITAGGGVVTLDDQGIKIVAGVFAGGYSAEFAIDFVDVPGGARTSSIYGTFTSGVNTGLFLESFSDNTSAQANITIQAVPLTGSGFTSSGITFLSEKTGIKSSQSFAAQAFLFSGGGLRVGSGSAAGATNGQLNTEGNVAFGAAINSALRVLCHGSGTTSGTAPLWVENSAGSTILACRDDIAIGFMGATPVVRPTVTGAKAGNLALGSLMTALANLGLVTNSTTA